MIAIRRYCGNPDLIDNLDARCFEEHHDSLDIRLDDVWWVAWDGKTPVAYAGLRTRRDSTTGQLMRAGVIRSARGSGLHRRMIRIRLRYAKGIGLTAVQTYTWKWNLRSANNLIRCGFKLYCPVYGWWKPDEWLYFKKDL